MRIQNAFVLRATNRLIGILKRWLEGRNATINTPQEARNNLGIEAIQDRTEMFKRS